MELFINVFVHPCLVRLWLLSGGEKTGMFTIFNSCMLTNTPKCLTAFIRRYVFYFGMLESKNRSKSLYCAAKMKNCLSQIKKFKLYPKN